MFWFAPCAGWTWLNHCKWAIESWTSDSWEAPSFLSQILISYRLVLWSWIAYWWCGSWRRPRKQVLKEASCRWTKCLANSERHETAQTPPVSDLGWCPWASPRLIDSAGSFTTGISPVLLRRIVLNNFSAHYFIAKCCPFPSSG